MPEKSTTAIAALAQQHQRIADAYVSIGEALAELEPAEALRVLEASTAAIAEEATRPAPPSPIPPPAKPPAPVHRKPGRQSKQNAASAPTN